MNCKKCGYALTENDKFCKNCGTPVSDAAVPSNNLGGYENIFSNQGSQPANSEQNATQVPNMQQQTTDYNGMNQSFNQQSMNSDLNNYNQTSMGNSLNNYSQQPINNNQNSSNNYNQQSLNTNQNNLNDYNQQPINTNPNGSNGYNQSPIKQNFNLKNNKNLFIIIGVVAIVLLMIILFLVGNNKDDNTSNNNNNNQVNENNNNNNNQSDNNSNEDDEEETNVSKSNYKVSYKGFDLEIPDNLIYYNKNDSLYISDEADTWLVVFDVTEGSFDKLRTNKSQLKIAYEQSGFEASDAVEKTYNGINYIISEISLGGDNVLSAYAKVNSMYVAGLNVYTQNNDFDYSLLESFSSIISSLKYVGESNNIEPNNNINMSIISGIAK